MTRDSLILRVKLDAVAKTTKERRVWCYLNTADDAILREIMNSYDGKLNEATVLSVLIGPALRQCAENGYRLSAPTESAHRVSLNESAATPRTHDKPKR